MLLDDDELEDVAIAEDGADVNEDNDAAAEAGAESPAPEPATLFKLDPATMAR